MRLRILAARSVLPAVFSALLLGGVMYAPPQLKAQSSTQGAIAGTALDASAAALSGAAIAIENAGTGFRMNLTTDSNGFFKAPLLEPGTYSVTVTANGFATVHASALVQVGQVTTLTPHLSVASAATSVEVAEQVPVINLDSPDFSSNLNLNALQNIPMNNRRWSSLAMTTPGVVSDSSGYGLVSVRGISPILNNVEIDGADDNQAYYAEERGRTREAYSTSASAVREFAVNTGVYSAEYGRAAGGVITSVTRSGTNGLHGELYYNHRESNWAAFNNYAKISTFDSASDAYVSNHYKPEDMRKIYGFTAGGALIKDKLFWIYTFDQHAHIFPVVGVPNSTTFYSLPTSTLPTGASCNTATGYMSGDTSSNSTLDAYACTLAARQGVDYAAGVQLYNQGIATLTTDLGQANRAGYQEINTPKVDYQINNKNHVSVLYHRLRWDSPGGVQTAPTDHYARDTQGNDFVKLDYGVAKLTSLITSNISNELLYQYGRELNNESQQPFTDLTKTYLTANGNSPEVALATSTTGFYLGSPYYSYRKALPDERKWQVSDILYYGHGTHSFKFGADIVHNNDLINNTYESNGYFTYTYLGNFINDLLNEGKSSSTCNSGAAATGTATVSAVGSYPCYTSFYQGFGNPIFAINTTDYGFFAQDNWKLTPRLTLELGLRYDYEALPAASSNLTTATGTFVPYNGLSNNPSDKNNIGPRIGFSYDVYGHGTTVLRGGYGLYYGRVTNGVLLNVRLNTGSPNGQYTTTYKATTGPQLPEIISSTGTAPKPSSYFLAKNLQNPQVHEFDLLLQQAVGKGTIFSLSYLGALGRELPNFLDLNLNPDTVQDVTITVADSSGKGPLTNGEAFTVPTYTSYGNTALLGASASNFQAITQVTSNINSSYHAMVAEIQNRSLKHLQFDANYTWAHALDFAQNATTTTTGNNWYDPYSDAHVNYGNSSYDVRNRFTAYVLYQFPGVRSASQLHWLVNGWSLGNNFQMQSGLPYTLALSNYSSYKSVLTGWNGSGGASFIPMIGPNTLRYPRRIVDDLRVQKEVAFTERYKLQLMANVFNVANHQNVDGITGTAYVFSSCGSSCPLQGTATYQSTTFQNVTSSNNSGFLYTPRQIEISTRFVF
jgi:hypothetical protein